MTILLVAISVNLYAFQITFSLLGGDLFGIIFRRKKKVKTSQPTSDTSLECSLMVFTFSLDKHHMYLGEFNFFYNINLSPQITALFHSSICS